MPALKALREAAFYSQVELAARARIARSTLRALEAGALAHGRTIRKLAEALGVDPARLLEEPDA